MPPRKPPARRSQNYTFIVYPESTDDHWKDRLKELGIDALISPLHDPDPVTEDDDGQFSIFKGPKPHYHVVLIYGSVQSLAQAREDAIYVGAANGYVERVKSMNYMCKYLCHLNEKDKPRYNPADVEVIGDYDYLGKVENEEEDDLDIMMDITAFIDANNITSFKQFAVRCAFENQEWFKICYKKRTMYISALIRSNREDNDPKFNGATTT